jgi:ELP3 family radical SAM enzyme/protein acetyltransferase
MFSTKYASNYTLDDFENIFKKEKFQFELSEDDLDYAKEILINNMNKVDSHMTYQTHILNKMRKRPNLQSKTHILKAYYILVNRKEVPYNITFIKFGSIKSTRGHSGVQVITIMTSGHFMKSDDKNDDLKDIEEFNKTGGCPMNCYFCPFQKDEEGKPPQPRSYLDTEPANKRASQNKHHPVGQIFDRLFQLEEIGHIPSIYMEDINLGAKLEMIISGGTFNFYPKDYIIWFVTCMYYAANIYYDYRKTNKLPRDILSLEEEQKINEKTNLRMIGLTIETRPDYLDPFDFNKDSTNKNLDKYEILRFFRMLGITRVQIGVQHINDKILRYVNRQCTDKQNIKAIKFLKDNGFKVDIHLMLDLPKSSPEEDKRMLSTILDKQEYQADQWKIYPTEVTDFTVIKKWYDEGKYQPYAEEDGGNKLMDVIIHAKLSMKPWIRINRIIRDIPPESIEGGINCPDMREQIRVKMDKLGITCNCIRCREIKLEKISEDEIIEVIRYYEGSDGDEYFISYETIDNKKLIGFIRLRLNRSFDNTMPELHNMAFIRELHVLGYHTKVGLTSSGVQHKGYGTKLIEKAEQIALENGYKGISVISGVGVREYYHKKGYHLENHNMVKHFYENKNNTIQLNYIIYIIFFVIIYFIIKKMIL